MIDLDRLQNRTLLIGGQECGGRCISLTSPLRQQLIAMLDDRVAHRTLDFGGQSAFAVKTLALGDVWQCVIDQAIKGIVAVVTKNGFARRCHGWLLRRSEERELSIGGFARVGY
jgi:hypothetical protein